MRLNVRDKKTMKASTKKVKEWRSKNRDKYLALRKNGRIKNRVKNNLYAKLYRQRTKLEVLAKYGVLGIPRCVICGEGRIPVLSIDHVDGGGTRHRKQFTSVNQFYRMLIKSNFPVGYRTLCMNCQFMEAFDPTKTHPGGSG